MNGDRLEFLAQIASWYYEDQVSQDEIASRIGKSRSMVSRLLTEARDMGLVEIRVNHPLKTNTALENLLCETFHLRRAYVLANPPADYTAARRLLGQLGARCLQEYLQDGMRLGTGWGSNVYEVVRALPYMSLNQVKVIQLLGALGRGDPLMDGPELARWLAEKLRATYRFLSAPLLVEESVAKALMEEPGIAETLAMARKLDVVVASIGVIEKEYSGLYRSGHLSENDLHALKRAGAVGDVLAYQLDSHGRVVDDPQSRRIIGVDLKVLRSVPTVIGVAGGAVKAPAILAAMRGRYVNVLVTDSEAASAVLALQRQQTQTA